MLDRSLLLAEETAASYGRRRTGPALEAKQAVTESAGDMTLAAEALLAYDEAHGTRAGAHRPDDFGPGLIGQRAYIRQEYAL